MKNLDCILSQGSYVFMSLMSSHPWDLPWWPYSIPCYIDLFWTIAFNTLWYILYFFLYLLFFFSSLYEFYDSNWFCCCFVLFFIALSSAPGTVSDIKWILRHYLLNKWMNIKDTLRYPSLQPNNQVKLQLYFL